MTVETQAAAGPATAGPSLSAHADAPPAALPVRRTVLKMLAAAGAAAPFLPAGAAAEDSKAAKTTKGAAWVLGDNLSLAALLYAQDASDDLIDQTLGKAKKIAEAIGLEIKPFPKKSKERSGTDADVIHYLIKGDGAALGSALSRKFDDDHGTLFEVAVKSNLLIILYAPKDSLGKTIADVIKTRFEGMHIPPKLWKDLVTLVYNGKSADDVKKAVFKMHKDVADYYLADT